MDECIHVCIDNRAASTQKISFVTNFFFLAFTYFINRSRNFWGRPMFRSNMISAPGAMIGIVNVLQLIMMMMI